MKVWHICSEVGFDKFLNSGVKRGHGDHIFHPSFKEPYDWMMRQMERRLNLERPRNGYPVWVWYRYNGLAQPSPLLSDPLGEPGEKLVLLELEVPEHHVLLSDFELWHAVLNNFPIDDDEEFAERYHRNRDQKTLCAHDIARTHQSWEKIFDLAFYDTNWTSAPEKKSVQGCLWELHLEQLVSYEHFTSVDMSLEEEVI
jgi:hypothetical protein